MHAPQFAPPAIETSARSSRESSSATAVLGVQHGHSGRKNVLHVGCDCRVDVIDAREQVDFVGGWIRVGALADSVWVLVHVAGLAHARAVGYLRALERPRVADLVARPSEPHMTNPNEWRHCSTCKTPIEFGQRYYQCSVSTCNRGRTALFFCSVPCWDAHVPTLRHRDAWAEETKAPSREEWAREQNAAEAHAEEKAGSEAATVSASAGRRIVNASPPDVPAPREVLVVVSKLKQYVRARSGMNTSDAVMDVLSDHLRAICDRAIDVAQQEGRKTVLDRDVTAVLRARD